MRARFRTRPREFERRMAGELPRDFAADAAGRARSRCRPRRETIATRKASQNALEALAPVLPELIGGSADLTGSNLTKWSAAKALRPDALDGRHINYGVREFGMSAIDERHRAARRLHSVRRHVPRRSPTTRATRCAWRR